MKVDFFNTCMITMRIGKIVTEMAGLFQVMILFLKTFFK